MKSRTLSYKGTWLKKNITRFAPFWVLYTLCLLLGLAVLSNNRDGFYYMMNLSECARVMAVINCGYALLTAQLLFGDLYSSRMCYGIHALPMRRDEIFAMNLLSGLLFSLVPTALMTIFALPMAFGSGVVGAAAIPLLWFAAANLQYLFSFSLAVLCALIAGNRFSMAVIYGILNFLSLLLYLLVESLYMPLLPGVSNPFEWFRILCPVGKIAADPLILLTRTSQEIPGTFEIQAGSWSYLLLCAALGLLLLILALQMYRKRSLEAAGEFIAVKALQPVFLILFSLVAAMALNLVARMFFGSQEKTALAVSFSVVGLIAGWFVGLMLMEKTPRVFRKQTFAGVGILIAVVAASLLLTFIDIFHVASWVPDYQEVESVFMISGYQNFGEYWTERDNYRITEPEELATVVQMHGLAISEGLGPEDARWYYQSLPDAEDESYDPAEYRFTVPLSLEYHMKDGAVRRRFYYIYADGEAGTLAETLFSRPSMVLEDAALLESQEPASWIGLNGLQVEDKDLTAENTRDLLDAIQKDFRDGTLAQQQEFHPVPVYADGEIRIPGLYLSIGFGSASGVGNLSLDVYSDSTHIMLWLQDHGLLQKVIEAEQQYR